MLADYLGILVICAVGVILVAAMLAAHVLLRPKRSARESPAPLSSDERGSLAADPGTAEKFVLFACLFVAFEVAALLIYPWAAVFRELAWFGYGAILVFSLPLTVGLVYHWLKGGLEW